MGILRLYLAICVVAAHSESVLPWRSHGGREAVQIFFIISGFYMQMILSGSKYDSVWKFYRSRLLRIFVPYFLSLLLVVTASLTTGLFFGHWLTLKATVGLFTGVNDIGVGTAFATMTNGSLFFQDWVMFLQQTREGQLAFILNFRNSEGRPLWQFLWIPQAWSIGVELTFYIVAPFLVRKLSLGSLAAIAGTSLALRIVCYSNFEMLNDPWVYRFFPFELLHFCYGIIGCRVMQKYDSAFSRVTAMTGTIEGKTGRWFYPICIVVGLTGLFVHRGFFGLIGRYAELMVTGGREFVYLSSLALWGIVVPLLFSMMRKSKVDRAVGELSYPVYLLHYTVCLLVAGCFSIIGLPQNLRGETAAIASVAIAILMQVYLLNRFEKWRQTITRKNANQKRHPSCGSGVSCSQSRLAATG